MMRNAGGVSNDPRRLPADVDYAKVRACLRELHIGAALVLPQPAVLDRELDRVSRLLAKAADSNSTSISLVPNAFHTQCGRGSAVS